MSLKKSLFWSYISRYADVILQFGSSLFLARLLTPDEIGTYAVTMSLIGFVTLLRDFGIGEYLIQEKDLSHNKIRTAYTFALIISLILGVLVFLSAEVIAEFYQKEEMVIIIHLISINFLLIPFSSIIFSLLRRNMQFKQRAYIETSTGLTFALVAIYLAYTNFGALSLAIASVTSNIITILLCFLVRPNNFSYTPYLKLEYIKPIINYGGLASSSQFIRHAGTSAPNILIGKFLDMTNVGLFNRALSLLNMLQKIFLDGLRPVLMPYFSQIKRQKENPATNYIMILSIILAIMWPCLAFILIEAPILIDLLFGIQWLKSIPLLQILCIASIISMTIALSDELFKATGHIYQFFIIQTIMTPLRILAVFIGTQYNLLTVVLLLSVLPLLRVFITNYIIFKYFEVNIKSYMQMLLKNIGLLFICIVPLLIFHHFYLLETIYMRLLVDIIIISINWILGMFLLHRQLSLKLLSFVGLKKQEKHS